MYSQQRNPFARKGFEVLILVKENQYNCKSNANWMQAACKPKPY